MFHLKDNDPDLYRRAHEYLRNYQELVAKERVYHLSLSHRCLNILDELNERERNFVRASHTRLSQGFTLSHKNISWLRALASRDGNR